LLPEYTPGQVQPGRQQVVAHIADDGGGKRFFIRVFFKGRGDTSIVPPEKVADKVNNTAGKRWR
jgi:hypothetical protein